MATRRRRSRQFWEKERVRCNSDDLHSNYRAWRPSSRTTGSRVLRFTNFGTSNDPDIHVYMVATDDAKDSASVQRAGFIDLGTIKGNIGNQNYALGPDVDLSKYRAVSVWCKRFSVNFGTAPLTPDHMMSRK